MDRWGFEFSIHILILSIAMFTHSVFECSPRCTGLVQLSSARPSLPGLVLAQVYRSRPVVQGSPRCTGLTHYNGERRSGDGYHTGANCRKFWCIPYWKMGDEAVYGLVAGDGGLSEAIVTIRMIH